MASKPFVWTNKAKLSWSKLDGDLEKALRKAFPEAGQLGIGIADLATGNAVGFRESEVGYAASLTKIAAMYAAFHLQAAMKKASVAGIDWKKLSEHMKGEWGTEIKSQLGGNAKGDFPDLTKVFLDKGFEFSEKFWNEMYLMIAYSKNESAAYCIQALGFDYLAASLVYGGFYSLAAKKGLWLSGDFVGGYQPGLDGKPAPGVEKVITEPSQRHQVATAEAVTLLMVNLGRGELIDKTACDQMKSLMTDSYAKRENEKVDPFQTGKPTIYGKIGIQPDNKSFDDTAVVERHCLSYTMTVLFMPKTVLWHLFNWLDRVADYSFHSSKAACEAKTAQVKSFSANRTA